MKNPQADERTSERRSRDEAIAAEPPLDVPDLPADVVGTPVEGHLQRLRRPVAVAGVVENGVVRPLDPTVRLPERSHVIIVAKEPTSQ